MTTFALTKFKAYGVQTEGSTRRHAAQVVEMVITGTTADVALDFDNASGTFWTAALADATYGTLATQALADITAISSRVSAVLTVSAQNLLGRVQVATLSAAGQYTIVPNATTFVPAIALNATDGDLLYNPIRIVWSMLDTLSPVVDDLGAKV